MTRWAVIILLPVLVSPVFTATSAQAAVVSINLLTINDFHGRIDENTLRFAGTVQQLRAEAGDANTLLIGAGDLYGASLFASASQQDQPTIDVMNELGIKASTVGNHELDNGIKDLDDRVIGTDPGAQHNAQWDYLCANIYMKGRSTPAFPEYGLYKVAGVTVGVIGALTQQTASLVSPAGVATVDFGDPVDAVNRVAAQLSDGDPTNGEASIIVASFHDGALNGTSAGGTLGTEAAREAGFAKMVIETSPAVDVIVNGHTHQAYAWDGPIPDAPDRTRPVIQAGSYGQYVGQVSLSYDVATDEVVRYTNADVPTMVGSGSDAAAIAASNAALEAQLLARYPIPLNAVKTTLDSGMARAAQLGRRPVGSITADITSAFSGGRYINGLYGGTFDRDDRAGESTLGNAVANALLQALSSAESGAAEIGVVNPGGLRADLLYGGRGIISYAEANAVLPSAMDLATVTLTGGQLKELLEQQWQTTSDNTPPSHPYLQLGLSDNVSYTFDPDAERGSHITSLIVNGEPVADSRSYRIGTLRYLASGGDNFRVLTEATAVTDSGSIDRDAWIGYLTAHPALAPTFARRSAAIRGLRELPPPGAIATLDVSMLDMTSLGAPANTSVAVQLISTGRTRAVTDVGTFPVTKGAAKVTFRVPPAGADYLAMKVTPSNTEVKVLLTKILPASENADLAATGPLSSTASRRIAVGVVVAIVIVWLTVAALRRHRKARSHTASTSQD